MKPSNMFNSDDRAVSPVIGVILMVAITVILAAVIGTFVLGLGDSLGDNQPTAQLNVDTNVDASTNNITIEHSGGDRIESGSLNVIISDPAGSNSSEGTIGTALTVGDTVEGQVDGSGAPADVRVRIVHTSSDSILLDRTFENTDDLELEDSGSITF